MSEREEQQTAPVDFEVKRTNLAECRFVPAPVPRDLASGEVLVAVDRFALTANNVTYAVAGDMLGYWSFFPAEEGWGRIPISVNLKSSASKDREGAPAERPETAGHRRVIGADLRSWLPR